MEIEKIISNYYKTILQREPDKNGLSYFMKKFDQNQSLDEIYYEIKNSDEAQILKMNKFEKTFPVFQSTYSKQEIQKIYDDNSPWYHVININDIETQNTRTSKAYQMWASQDIPKDLTNKTVLDVGCADGFYSFLCESRCAKVVSIDSEEFDVVKINLFPKKTNPNKFQICKKILNSQIEYKKLDIYEIDALETKFNYVLLYGVYYHLQDLVLALQKVSKIVTESVFLSGHILNSDEPLMYYYDVKSGSKIMQFSPIVASANCLLNIAKNFCGFESAEITDIINFDYGEIYPHNYGSTKGKIGLFKFTKKL